MMAAAEVMTEGAWWRLSNVPSSDRFDEPTVCDVDFPAVALSRAEWDGSGQKLYLAMHAMNDAVLGRPTTMRVTGLGDPRRWIARTSDGPQVDVTQMGSDLLLHTSVGQQSVVVEQNQQDAFGERPQ
jgi:hypothetical protein